MTDYTELVKSLRIYANDETDEIRAKAADAIEVLQKQLLDSEVDNINLTGWLAEEHAKHLWVSCDERLPEMGEIVLLFDGKDVGDGFLFMYNFNKNEPIWSTPFADLETENISHWMPLPEPPEESES